MWFVFRNMERAMVAKNVDDSIHVMGKCCSIIFLEY